MSVGVAGRWSATPGLQAARERRRRFRVSGTRKGNQGNSDSSHNCQQRQHAKNYRIQTPGKIGAAPDGPKNGDRNQCIDRTKGNEVPVDLIGGALAQRVSDLKQDHSTNKRQERAERKCIGGSCLNAHIFTSLQSGTLPQLSALPMRSFLTHPLNVIASVPVSSQRCNDVNALRCHHPEKSAMATTQRFPTLFTSSGPP